MLYAWNASVSVLSGGLLNQLMHVSGWEIIVVDTRCTNFNIIRIFLSCLLIAFAFSVRLNEVVRKDFLFKKGYVYLV